MKKIGITLLAASFLMVACSPSSASSNNSDSTTLTVVGNPELLQATEDYKSFVVTEINQLLLDTQEWAEVLKDGDLEKAKEMYPHIRMAYERSEPIAESFGESDVKIDFREVDYVDENGSEDGWRGFHRIEKILWTENTTKGTEEYVDFLIDDIKELKAKIVTIDVEADLMLTGAVDLLNEVATTKITGEEEIFSHTDLYDFRANIQGAEKIFELFKPLLSQKDKNLVATLEEQFSIVNGLLDEYMTDKKNYKLYTDLTTDDTKKLAEAVTKLGEPLSQMGIILE